jgi:hypothetical protein
MDILPNPSPRHPNMLAYITPAYSGSPSGPLFWYDLTTQKAEQVDPNQNEYTCMTFSHDGDTLLMCTRAGEALYYDLSGPGKFTPIRRPLPTDLPQLEGDSWWSMSPSTPTNRSYPRSSLDRCMESTRHIQSTHPPLRPASPRLPSIHHITSSPSFFPRNILL